MPKRIVLDNEHRTIPGATSYKLIKLLVQYEVDTAVVLLEDQTGRGHQIKIDGIPATTQPQAILARINNGVFAGRIEDVPEPEPKPDPEVLP